MGEKTSSVLQSVKLVKRVISKTRIYLHKHLQQEHAGRTRRGDNSILDKELMTLIGINRQVMIKLNTYSGVTQVEIK